MKRLRAGLTDISWSGKPVCRRLPADQSTNTLGSSWLSSRQVSLSRVAADRLSSLVRNC